jgi:uncharacterized protein (DUF2235 family)
MNFMKHIVLSCDGTWNRIDTRLPSNALRIARAVLPEAPDGTTQVVCHVDGVGSGRGTGWLARVTDAMLGGALGFGLMDNVLEAYRFLVFNYAPGDRVFLFGYSRGAFTSRSLVGLIRNCGLLQRNALSLLPKALDFYRARNEDTHPNSPQARAFRERYAIGGADHFPDLAYLGVWDTVGSLGIPAHLLWARWLNRAFAFHDTNLTGKVAAARHAVAIDERKRTFQPALWRNLAELNALAGAPRYQQIWFPGDHGCVGGSASLQLANEALLWVAAGAMEAGLVLSPDRIVSWTDDRDASAPIPIRSGTLRDLVSFGHCDRSGPEGLPDLSPAAIRRWHLDPAYRPGSLSALAGKLDSTPGDDRDPT